MHGGTKSTSWVTIGCTSMQIVLTHCCARRRGLFSLCDFFFTDNNISYKNKISGLTNLANRKWSFWRLPHSNKRIKSQVRDYTHCALCLIMLTINLTKHGEKQRMTFLKCWAKSCTVGVDWLLASWFYNVSGKLYFKQMRSIDNCREYVSPDFSRMFARGWKGLVTELNMQHP